MKIQKFNEQNQESTYYEELGYEYGILDYLSLSYQLWLDAEGLEQLSADEHDTSKLTSDQRIYLQTFIKMWDISSNFDSKYRKPEFILGINAKKYNL